MLSRFTREHRAFQKEPDGRQTLEGLQRFNRRLGVALDAEDLTKPVADVADWLNRLPGELLTVDQAPLIELTKLSREQAHLAIVEGLQVLVAGLKGALSSSQPLKEDFAGRVLRVAFGDDAASAALRRPLVDRKFPGIPPLPSDPGGLPGLKDLPDISRLVRDGAMNKLITQFATCGWAAQQERNWVGGVQPLGTVTKLATTSPCGGGSLTISYSGFGAQPPDPALVADIVVSLPTRGGCEHVRLRQLDPQFFDARRWKDSGTITVSLPAGVSAGCVGFFTLPPPITGSGPCTAGSLLGAAGEVREILVQQFGPAYGVMYGEVYLGSAAAAESGRHIPLPCAACQADGRNQLNAGPPVIDRFWVVETGPVYPRNTITLEWSVFNATAITITAQDVANSETKHQLPAIPGPIGAQGRVVLQVPCSRRWEGEYEIRVANGNGCGPSPVTARVRVRSGFSLYRLACGKADITDRRPNLGMQGFAYTNQKTSGAVHLPLFARAFYIGENTLSPTREFTVIAVADIWSCSEPLKSAVINQLNQRFGHPPSRPFFTVDNVMICGTHTHSAPGGYFHHALYNLTVGGFDQQVFDTLVNGIADAITSAVMRAVPGRLYVNRGEVIGCGSNRSFAAYQKNLEYQRGATQGEWTDRWMTLLRFEEDVDNLGTKRPLGCLNWYAIHPTNLGMFNNQVSGDNKGWAARQMEDEMASKTTGGAPFVAAFANAAAGDVSGNVVLDARGRVTTNMPVGGSALPSSVFVPPRLHDPGALARNLAQLQRLGERQAKAALDLFAKAQEEVTGPVSCQSTFVDMGNVPIAGQNNQRTWPAAMGVSFGAGSSEDSVAYATMGPFDIDAGIIEGISQTEWTLGAIQFWSAAIFNLGPYGAVAAAAFASGAKVPLPLLAPLLVGVAGLVLFPWARAYAAARLAALVLEGQLPVPQDPGDDGSWTWQVPAAISLPPDYVAGHGAKPIMFPAGLAQLVYTPGPRRLRPAGPMPCPLVPNVVPLQLLRVGQVAIAAVPAEITATAGRRLAARLMTVLRGQIRYAPVCSYANGYAGYIATPEEYDAQHYEGASTLFGPHTLAAFAQSFEGLAARLNGAPGTAIAGETGPFGLPAFHRKP